MANDMNMVALLGRLTRDPEISYTNSGLAILNMSLAVNKRKKSGDSWVDDVSFFDVAAYGKTAENLNKYLMKGKQIAVKGELRQSRWEKDGQKHSKIYIAAESIQMLADPQGQGSSTSNTTSRPASTHSQQSSRPRSHAEYSNQYGTASQDQGSRSQAVNDGYAGPEMFDDDIPF